MRRTLILMFHPDPARSRANAALAGAAAALPDVTLVEMATACPHGLELERDGAAEAARLLTADRLVLQFPLYWYATPPLLKAWQDAVLTRMMYLTHETEGRHLAGVPVMVAVTAGNTAESYQTEGRNRFAMADLLAPLRATAHRCGLVWADPFVLYRADKLDEAELADAAGDYARHLARWIASPRPADRKAA